MGRFSIAYGARGNGSGSMDSSQTDAALTLPTDLSFLAFSSRTVA